MKCLKMYGIGELIGYTPSEDGYKYTVLYFNSVYDNFYTIRENFLAEIDPTMLNL